MNLLLVDVEQEVEASERVRVVLFWPVFEPMLFVNPP